MTNTLETIKEVISEGCFAFPKYDGDYEVTDFDGRLTLFCGNVNDCIDYTETNFHGANESEKAVMLAWMELSNAALNSWYVNATDNQKAAVRKHCPEFYAAAKNVHKIEGNGPFIPWAILGEKKSDNDATLNMAINASNGAWYEQGRAEDGDYGKAAMDALTCAFDAILEAASDPDYSCQIQASFTELENGIKVSFATGNPRCDMFTHAFDVVIPDGASRNDVITAITDAAREADYNRFINLIAD